MDFLGFDGNLVSRKKVAITLNEMLNLGISSNYREFERAKSSYHVVEPLTMIPKGRFGTIVSRVIHPIVTLKFLKFDLVFPDKLKAK